MKTSSIVVVIKSPLSRWGYQQAVTVKLLNLEQAGKPVADPAAMQRYSTEMLNVIAAGLDKTLPMPQTPRRTVTVQRLTCRAVQTIPACTNAGGACAV